jgi:hypothetical protein
MEIEMWTDASGVIWELVELSYGEGSEFLIRERNRLDVLDGDSREGLTVLARFQTRASAETYLYDEGFEPSHHST